MTELDQNNEMLDALESVKEVKVGDVVRGEVLSLQDGKQVIVGIEGTGVEGVIPARELSTLPVDNIDDIVKVGDVLDLVVISPISDKENGSYLLSKRRLDAKKVWTEIEEKYKNGELVEGKVKDIVRGGLVIDLGVRGFVPASMITDHFIEDFSDYKGKTLTLKIMEIEPSENRLILSHRAVMEEEKAEARAARLAEIVAGDILEGKVARLTDFGAFVDLGGVDGLVHVSEIAHEHVSKPSDVLKVGQDVKVKVLSVDPEAGRVSLSIKATQKGPWERVEDEIHEGDVVEGKVKRLTDFGAFVEILPGVEGLLHISQISHKHIATPHEVLTPGDDIRVKVLEMSPKERRIALSLKALEEQPESYVGEKEEVYEMPEESTGFTMADLADVQNEDK